MAQHPAARRLQRSNSSFRERLEDAGAVLSKSLTIGREAVLDATSFLDPAQSIQAILEKQEAAEGAKEGEAAEGELETVPEDEVLEGPEPTDPAKAQRRHSMLEAVGRSVVDPDNLELRDKICFVLGVGDIAATFYWLGHSPQTYYHFWVFKSIALFTLRWFAYKNRGWHWMMLEFCYAANLLGALHLYFFPQSALLRKLAFAQLAGPLMWAIVAMRNSLVFHDFDKMTTLMMHASPALVAWSMRWYPRPEWTKGMSPAQLAAYNRAGFVDLAVLPMAFYLLWAAGYYVVTFLLFAKRMKTRGYTNMYTYMVLREQARKSALARLVLRAPRPLQPFVYLSVHMGMSWIAVLPTVLLWHSRWLHTAVLLGILLQCTWNGAQFYFKVFAKKYLAEVQAHKEARAAGKQQ